MATKSSSARSYAFLSIGAAVVTIALKFFAYLLNWSERSKRSNIVKGALGVRPCKKFVLHFWVHPSLLLKKLDTSHSLYNLVCGFNQIVRNYLWLGVNTEVVLLLLSNEGSS